MRRALREGADFPLVFRPRRRENLSLHVVGLALLFLVPGMLVATLVEWGSANSDGERALLTAALITAAAGVTLAWGFRPPDDVRPTDTFPVVVWTWVACSLFGTLPYVLDADMFGWAQWDAALFESISGFTASGSTVLVDIETHGRGMLIWRQLTQWYGGMGMIVLAVSVLPLLGVGGQELMRAEIPGPESDRLAPRISGTAKRLWAVYAGLTVAIGVALFAVPGVGLYDAAAHALTVSATGGFSPYGASIGHFDSLAVELIVAGGLIVGSMSFSLHYRAVLGNLGVYRRASDQMLFLKMLAGATGVVTLLLWLRQGAPFGLSLRDGFFNVVTLASSGGFHNIRRGGLGDFAAWLPPAQVVLAILMLIGGGAGSTSGGMKVFRGQIAAAHALRSIRQARRPRAVLPIKLGGSVIPEHIVGRVLGYGTLFIVTFGVGTLVVASLGAEPVTAASGVIAAMSNMGPALGEAGPASNFTVFTRPARLVLAGLMLVGRLEITAVFLGAAVILRHLRLRR